MPPTKFYWRMAYVAGHSYLIYTRSFCKFHWSLSCAVLMAVTGHCYLIYTRSFCKFHCFLRCAVLPCALVQNYLVNRTAYDETTAWCYVLNCLEPLRYFQLKIYTYGIQYIYTVCDVTIWHHIYVYKPTVWRNLLIQHAYYSTRTLLIPHVLSYAFPNYIVFQ